MPSGTEELATPWEALKASWQNLLRIQVITLLAASVLSAVVLGLLVRGGLAATHNRALSDTAILDAVLDPVGLAIAFVILTASLTLGLLGYAAQLLAARAALHRQETRVTPLLLRIGRCLPSLLRLCLRYLLHLLVIALPFLMLAWLVVRTQLGERDINYYLDARPPEFVLALVFCLCLLLVMALLLVRQTIRWFHSLPLLLFRGLSANEARRRSFEVSAGNRRRIFTLLALWMFCTPLLVFLVHLPWPPLALAATEFFHDRLGLASIALSLLFLCSTALTLLIEIAALSLLALFHARMFHDAGLDPEGPDPGLPATAKRLPWRSLCAAAAAAIAIAALLIQRQIDQVKPSDEAVVIAHRGAAAEAPENSLAAVRRAIELEADWVEIDVQESIGGEILVAHDRDLMRVAGSPVVVRDADPAELAGIDIGSSFSPRFSEERVPTLREVLELCRDRVGLVIELKYYGHEERLEERVVDLVEEAGMADQVRVMSLSYEGVRRTRKLRPDWNYGLLSSLSVGDLTALDLDFLGIQARQAGPRLLRRAHKAGVEVFVWTVNDPADISAQLSMGVDGLITDDPATARTVLHERAELNVGERLMIAIAARLGHALPEFNLLDRDSDEP